MHRQEKEREREGLTSLKGCTVFHELLYNNTCSTRLCKIHSLIFIPTRSSRWLSFKHSLLFPKYKIPKL